MKNLFKHFNIKNLVFSFLVLVVLLLVAVYGFGLKIGFMPAGYAAGNMPVLKHYYFRLNLAKRIDANLNNDQQAQIKNRFFDNALETKLLSQRNIAINKSEIEDYFENFKTVAGKKDLAELGITDEDFKEEISKPDLSETKLQIWLASQQDLNTKAYQQLNRAKADLKGGISFEDTARKYSDDTLNAKIGGDIGAVGLKELPLELYSDVAKAQDSGVHFAVSRYGLHLYEVLNSDDKGPNNTKRYHLKQIFIKTTDFKSWFDQQKKNSIIVKFI